MKNWLFDQEIHAPKAFIQKALKTIAPYGVKSDQWEKINDNQWHWSYKGLIKEGMTTIEIDERNNNICNVKATIICNPTYRFLMDKKQQSWIEHCLKKVWFEGVKYGAEKTYKREMLEKKNKHVVLTYENVWNLHKHSIQRLCNEVMKNEWFVILAKEEPSLLVTYKTLMAEGRCVMIKDVMDEMEQPTDEEIEETKKSLASLATKMARWEEL